MRRANSLSKILEIIGVREIGRYSNGDIEAVAPFGIGVMFALRQQSGKLPDFKSGLNKTANFVAKIIAIFLKKRGKKPSGSVPP